jgi:hypothetical protein
MIQRRFILTLHCDGESPSDPCGIGQFEAESQAKAFAEARHAGWTLWIGTGRCFCPKHRRRSHRAACEPSPEEIEAEASRIKAENLAKSREGSLRNVKPAHKGLVGKGLGNGKKM